MKVYSVTFSHIYEGIHDYHPRTAVFSSRRKAEAFRDRVMRMHDARDQDYLVATIDSGEIDSEVYYEWFDREMRDGVSCETCRWHGEGRRFICTICQNHDLWEEPDPDAVSDCTKD